MIVWCQKSESKLDLRSRIFNAHIIPGNEMNQALAAIHSQTLQLMNTIKYYYDFYLLIQNSLTTALMWIRFKCVRGDQYILSTHTSGLLQLLAISYNTTISQVSLASPEFLHTQPSSKRYDMRCSGTLLQVHCHMKSGQKSDIWQVRQSGKHIFWDADIVSEKSMRDGQGDRWLDFV